MVVCFFLIGSILTGCGYRVLDQYPCWPEGIRKIYVETIRNQTSEPGLDKVLTDALIQEFWHWDKVRIVNRDEAQAILTGIINKYAADQPLSIDRDRTIREYRVTISLNLRLKSASTGKTLWQENGITAQEDYQFFKDDLARTRSQENQARQKASADLARRLLDQRFTGH
jgi:outer membrane lipopolysaccharide assembly protein LptE/RlpB